MLVRQTPVWELLRTPPEQPQSRRHLATLRATPQHLGQRLQPPADGRIRSSFDVGADSETDDHPGML